MIPATALRIHTETSGRPAVLVALQGGRLHLFGGRLTRALLVPRGARPVCGTRTRRRMALVASADLWSPLCGRCARWADRRSTVVDRPTDLSLEELRTSAMAVQSGDELDSVVAAFLGTEHSLSVEVADHDGSPIRFTRLIARERVPFAAPRPIRVLDEFGREPAYVRASKAARRARAS